MQNSLLTVLSMKIENMYLTLDSSQYTLEYRKPNLKCGETKKISWQNCTKVGYKLSNRRIVTKGK